MGSGGVYNASFTAAYDHCTIIVTCGAKVVWEMCVALSSIFSCRKRTSHSLCCAESSVLSHMYKKG